MMDVFRLEGVGLTKSGTGIFDSLDLSISSGGITTLLGPSGSGKTSLLRLLNRLDEPDSGKIYYKDQPIISYDVQTLRREVGMVFQRQELFEGTVKDNVLFGPGLHGMEVDLEEILDRVGLAADARDRDVATLSGGQAQKVVIARALAVDPGVLLLDEPTANLDPTSTLQIEEVVTHLSRELGLTCVFVTHNVEQAKRVGDSAVVLIEGQVVEVGPISDILANPRDPRTLRFARGELR
jgi:putative ABC transport system ATP-binding protein